MNDSMWEEAEFRTNVLLKNIIGKELINDDNVAVMELVKNAYDANAQNVKITFKQLFNNDDINVHTTKDVSRKTSQIIIQDDGIGMNKDDILTKWLNIAYSSKKHEQIQNNRVQAGAKGVGRFSCDRLGEFLNIYTRKLNEPIYHLQISWQDFEIENEIDLQIQDVKVRIRQIEDKAFIDKTGFDPYEHGTILQIIKLNNIWAEIEEVSLIPKIKKTKLLDLKQSLEKLINPNQSFDQSSFKIFLDVRELQEDNSLPYHEKVHGYIKNQIFSKLNFRTTYIESSITEDGTKIITILKDKNRDIFRLIEKNTEFPLLKNIKITLYYLSQYGKAYFRRQTGFPSTQFGSIFLFVNGFRISPYGDIDNDWLGLEARKNQGRSRFLSGREMIGRVEITDFNNQFRIISSREGIVQNNSFKQLVSDFGVKHNKYNGYVYKILRRLEKYVVEGLDWDSTEQEESEIQKLVASENWSESMETYKTSDREKANKTSAIIYSILGIKASDILDIYINEELIEHLIEEDAEKTNEKLQKFLKEYSKLSTESISIETKKAISKLSKKLGEEKSIPDELKQSFEKINLEKKKIEEELKEQKKSQKELYKLLRKKVREERKKRKTREQKLEEALKNEQKQKRFFQQLNTLDKQQILDLHHSIGTASETINNHISNIQSRLENNNPRKPINKEYLEEILKKIAFVNNKISTIAHFATKANFNADSEDMEDDLVTFISDYIDKVCMGEMKTIDHDTLNIVYTNDVTNEFNLRFKPIEIAMLFDNLISNSRKAGANLITIRLVNTARNLEIHFSDNGNGIPSTNNEKIFDLGFTTTDGSGMGLSHIKRILSSINGVITYDKNYSNGAKFIIRIMPCD